LRAASDDGREVQSEVCRVSGLPRSWRSRARQDVGGDPAAVRLPAGLHP
jgi:hypothetical protein